MKINKYLNCTFTFLFLSVFVFAQESDKSVISQLVKRAQPAPKSVFDKFQNAGMNPQHHPLTEVEIDLLSYAFELLTPLHKNILMKHLHSISFMDNMPNTALTSPVDADSLTQQFNITFRAGIFKETISQWATWKENSYYLKSDRENYEVVINAGNLDAIVYVLLHEATHIVDAVLKITPKTENIEDIVEPTPFISKVWYKMNEPFEESTSTLLETTRFRSGKQVPIAEASAVYKALKKSPFTSLYSMASWHEDLAELVTIYHLNKILKEPFTITVKKNDESEFNFEPLAGDRLGVRLENIEMFYTE